jgi:hypothetical protein
MAFLPANSASASGDRSQGNTPLSLGSVTFNSIEHPDELPLVLKQVTAVHEMIGGGRIVQTFGVQPQELKWEGNFFDSSAQSRVQTLAQMLAAGTPVTLSQGNYNFTVIITDFNPTEYHQFWFKYSICCQIIEDNSGIYAKTAPLNIDQQTSTSLSQVVTNTNTLSNLDSTFDASSIQASTVQNNLSALSSISTATSAELAPSVAAIASSQAYLTSYIAPLAALSAGSMTSTQMTALATAVKIQNGLSVVNSNLSTGQAPLTISVMNASAYALASQYYGDVSQYGVIKAANGLNSPFTGPTLTTLIIPTVASNNASS